MSPCHMLASSPTTHLWLLTGRPGQERSFPGAHLISEALNVQTSVARLTAYWVSSSADGVFCVCCKYEVVCADVSRFATEMRWCVSAGPLSS